MGKQTRGEHILLVRVKIDGQWVTASVPVSVAEKVVEAYNGYVEGLKQAALASLQGKSKKKRK